MRKIYTLLAAAVILLASCAKDGLDTQTPGEKPGGKVIITASTGVEPGTRMGFEEQEDKSIKLTWAQGDQFALYDIDGNFVATFKVKDEHAGQASADFVHEIGTEPTEGVCYKVVYPIVYEKMRRAT